MQIEQFSRDQQQIFNIINQFPHLNIIGQQPVFSKILVIPTYILETKRNFDCQYANFYQIRFKKIRPQFNNIVSRNKLNLIEQIQQILHQQTTIYIIGTLYKQMKLKHSVFDKKPIQLESYLSNDDTLYLEDLSGRIKMELRQNAVQVGLNGEILPVKRENLLTGLVVLVEGILHNTNLIQVSKIYYPQQEPQTPIIRQKQQFLMDITLQKQYVAIVSGLNFNSGSSELQMSKLLSFFQGKLNSGPLKMVINWELLIYQLVSQMVGVVIAGNLVHKNEELKDHLTGALKNPKSIKSSIQVDQDWREVDSFIHALPMAVHVMPGQNDPCSSLLPQQPLYRAFFPLSSQSNLHLHTNPMEARIGQVTMVGTSGQNVDDMRKYCNYSGIDLLQMNMMYNNLTPTAPDTLGCYPNSDPFVLTKWPHIYFVGNQSQFETRMLEQGDQFCRLITVPVYSTQQEICIIELNSLDCFSIKIE